MGRERPRRRIAAAAPEAPGGVAHTRADVEDVLGRARVGSCRSPARIDRRIRRALDVIVSSDLGKSRRRSDPNFSGTAWARQGFARSARRWRALDPPSALPWDAITERRCALQLVSIVANHWQGKLWMGNALRRTNTASCRSRESYCRSSPNRVWVRARSSSRC